MFSDGQLTLMFNFNDGLDRKVHVELVTVKNVTIWVIEKLGNMLKTMYIFIKMKTSLSKS